MYPLNTHVLHKIFGEPIFIVEVKVSPSMNIVDDRLFLPLTCIGEFNHANRMTSVIEAVKKIVLQLFPTIDWAKLLVSVLIKGITFQGTNKLFYHEIIISFDIVTNLHKMSYMLSIIPLAIRLLKLWWLIA